MICNRLKTSNLRGNCFLSKLAERARKKKRNEEKRASEGALLATCEMTATQAKKIDLKITAKRVRSKIRILSSLSLMRSWRASLNVD